MNAEAAPLALAGTPGPLAVADAAREVRLALERVRLSQRGYAGVRGGAVAVAVTRARTEWGLAVLEWIEASVTLAEAEDRRDPVRAARDNHARDNHARDSHAPGRHARDSRARDSRDGPPDEEEDPARGEVDGCWQAYQMARLNGRPDPIATARGRWRASLVAWFQALADERAAEDQRAAAERRRARERPGEPQPEPARQPTWQAARQAARQPAARAARVPIRQLAWEPAGRRPPAGPDAGA